MRLLQIFVFILVLKLGSSKIPPLQLIALKSQNFVELLVSRGLLKSNAVVVNSLKFLKVSIPLLGVVDIITELAKTTLDMSGKLDQHHKEVMTRLDYLEKILERSFETLTKEIKITEITLLQSKMKTEFEEFEAIFAAYSGNETELVIHLENFIQNYRNQKYETSIVNYLLQSTIGTKSALKYIYSSSIEDLKNNFNPKKTSPNRMMLDFYYSMIYFVYRGNSLLSYCYSLKDKILNQTSETDQQFIITRTNIALKSLKNAFIGLISLNDDKYLQTYVDLSPNSNENILPRYYEHIARSKFDIVSASFLITTGYINKKENYHLYAGEIRVKNEGYVITGVKFSMYKKVVYLQIQSGQLLPNGFINESSVYWQDKPKDLLNLNYSMNLTSMILDDLNFDNAVLTGLEFFKRPDGIAALRIFGRKLENLTLGREIEHLNPLTKKYFNVIDAERPDKPGLHHDYLENSYTYNISKNSIIEFERKPSIFKPMKNIENLLTFNGEEITLEIPAPLSGLGLLHYTNHKDYAGFIKPYLKTLHFKHLL